MSSTVDSRSSLGRTRQRGARGIRSAPRARASDLCQRGTRVGAARSSPRSSGCCAACVRDAGAAGTTDVYRRATCIPPTHWALRGEPPAFDTPDEDVYLTGPQHHPPHRRRRSTARSTASRASRLGRWPAIRFRTRHRSFSTSMARALSLGLAHDDSHRRAICGEGEVRSHQDGHRARRPTGADVIVHEPEGGLHCGMCSKCRERRDAFNDAGIADPTRYAVQPIR